MKQKELSLWIRGIALVGAIAVLLLAAIILPFVTADVLTAYPLQRGLILLCAGIAAVMVLPVLGVALLAWLIGTEIGQDNSFCMENARRLRLACILALTDTLLCLILTLMLAFGGLLHPGILLLLAGLMGLGIACAVVFAALSHLTRKAAELQGENDLTI